MPKSTAIGKLRKPPKPYDGFPLTAHNGGTWCKKILGKLHHFGRWKRKVNGKTVRVTGDGWKEALELYKAQADDLHAGRKPRDIGNGLTVRELCNRFLTNKQRRVDTGEIKVRSFGELMTTAKMVSEAFGKERRVDDLRADDFDDLRAMMSKRWGHTRLGNEIVRVRSIFNHAFRNGLIERPVTFGDFTKPSKSKGRNKKKKLFTPEQIQLLLDSADVHLRAMILLGVNCGFGNTDCGELPTESLDSKGAGRLSSSQDPGSRVGASSGRKRWSR